jgi:RNA polymerase sigma-70 factor (ECF subfamily)
MYCNNPDNRQDLFQEIVIQLWKAFPSFRQEAKFSTWMYRVAINTAISDIRRQKNRIRGIGIENIADEIQDEEYNREKEEQLRQLYSAIGQLSPIEKALVMLYLEDKSYDEMEDILGINQNNLRVKMNRVKEKLRKLTTQEED